MADNNLPTESFKPDSEKSFQKYFISWLSKQDNFQIISKYQDLPNGEADVLAWYKKENPALPIPDWEFYIFEVKNRSLRRQDLIQAIRYRTDLSKLYSLWITRNTDFSICSSKFRLRNKIGLVGLNTNKRLKKIYSQLKNSLNFKIFLFSNSEFSEVNYSEYKPNSRRHDINKFDLPELPLDFLKTLLRDLEGETILNYGQLNNSDKLKQYSQEIQDNIG